MRRLLTFACAGETLAATLDTAGDRSGLLIVSGGNELRIGAHRGMALLAAAVAAEGFPVFRFDRRGIGESTGGNGGFLTSAADIAAAAAAFRAETGVARVVAFGNCDAATALALFHRSAGIYALVLANPWVVEPTDDLPPPAAIRARYVAALRDPASWARRVRHGIDLRRLAHGLGAILRPRSRITPLMQRVVEALRTGTPTRILLADGDNTAIAFADQWRRIPAGATVTVERHPTDSHSFARDGDAAWLRAQLLAVLRRP